MQPVCLASGNTEPLPNALILKVHGYFFSEAFTAFQLGLMFPFHYINFLFEEVQYQKIIYHQNKPILPVFLEETEKPRELIKLCKSKSSKTEVSINKHFERQNPFKK